MNDKYEYLREFYSDWDEFLKRMGGRETGAVYEWDDGKLEVVNLVDPASPPRNDVCCDRCKRPVDELPRFGGSGHPLKGDFRDAVLVKLWREEGGPGSGVAGAVWLSRECIVLHGEEYYTKPTISGSA